MCPGSFSALQRAEIAEIVSVSSTGSRFPSFSALQRAEIAEIPAKRDVPPTVRGFSALQRAEIAEMYTLGTVINHSVRVSVLFNEPKLLKCPQHHNLIFAPLRFSALQRAEIAEIHCRQPAR